MTTQLIITDIERELGAGLIQGIHQVLAAKSGPMGSCSTVCVKLPLTFEGVAFIVSIATADDDAEEDDGA
jgi:hypothetical protein